MSNEQCVFVKKSGYWKGYRCCNPGKHEHEGNHYCAVHYGMVIAEGALSEEVLACGDGCSGCNECRVEDIGESDLAPPPEKG